MKSLLVLRHGKSDWLADYGSDHERPLAPRGVAAAELMGRFLSRCGQAPEAVLCSTAVRARRTAELASEAGRWSCPATYTDGLYGATVAGVVELIHRQDDALDRLLLVGHQPTWSELIADLCRGASVQLPTAALARIDLATEYWRDLRSASGTLRFLVTPKLLQRSGLEP